MTNAWATATILSFEQVPVAPTVILLRVSAQTDVDIDSDELRPALVADDGETVTRFAPIPAPADTGTTVRAAYSVASDPIAETTRFWLECADGSVVALDSPVPGATRITRTAAAAPDAPEEADRRSGDAAPSPPEEPDRRSEVTDRRSELEPKLAQLTEELATARHEATAMRDEADAAERAGAELTAVHREAAEMRAELWALRDLSGHAAAAEKTATAERASLRERLAALEESLGEAQHEREEAQRERGEAQRGREEAEHEAEQVAHERDAAAAAHEEAVAERDAAIEAQRQAEEAVEPLREAHQRAENDVTQLREQVRMMALERDELIRQAEAFDGVAVKARERAAGAESEHRAASARVKELEVWSGELERRLAETTTLLSEARSSAEQDTAELRRLRGELAEAEAHVELARAEIVSLSSSSEDSGRESKAVRKQTAEADEPVQADCDAAADEPD